MGTDLLARADALRTQRTPFVLATVVRAERPTSAKAGDRAIMLADGTIEGFVGGVCAESTVRAEGLRLLVSGESELLRITPTEDTADLDTAEGLVVVGNPCLSGGTLDIFLEAMLPAALVYVYGAAPIARAVATVAEAAGFAVAVATDAAGPIPEDAAAVVVASHGRDEESVLAAALRAGVPYVGLVASPRRGSAVVAGLEVAGDLRERVRTPAGLDIGARTPVEVAVSIVAELVSARAGTRPAPAVPNWPAPRASPAADRLPLPVVPLPRAATEIDPVCGMSVAAVPASLQLEHDGRTVYFCGPGCRQAFADDPGRYGAADDPGRYGAADDPARYGAAGATA
jgi:xanthine dehydrogenase accessory factor